MATEKVREFFSKIEMQDRIKEFEVSTATVQDAAKAIGCDGKQIAKSMAFIVDEQPIPVVTPGYSKIANAKQWIDVCKDWE